MLTFLATYAAAEPQQGLVAAYDLARADCIAGQLPPVDNASAFGTLTSINASCFDFGNGVARRGAGYLVSSANATKFVDHPSDGWLSVELWLQPKLTMSYQPLVAIGTIPVDAPTTCTAMTGLRIYASGAGDVYVEYGYDDGRLPRCVVALTGPILDPRTFDDPPYTHMVLVVGNDLRVYVNGTLVFDMDPFVDRSSQDFSSWAGFQLGLFTDNGLFPSTVDGAIHMLRLYARGLHADDVASNYRANIANSVPVTRDSSAVINEDGDASAGALSPQLYAEAELPLDALTAVALDAYDVDDDPRHPNYRDPHVRSHPMRVYVDHAPTMGQLYTVHGVALDGGDEVPLVDGSYAVLVRPPANAFGPGLVSWSFFAVDGVTGIASTAGTLSIDVLPVNDPPVVHERAVDTYSFATTSILLTGTDVEGDDIVKARLAALPAGSLYGVVNGTVRYDMRLSAGDEILGVLVVAYRFEDTVTAGSVVDDTFAVELADADGFGAAGNITLRVTTSIVATARQLDDVLEDSATEIKLDAYDLSDLDVAICATLVNFSVGSEVWSTNGTRLHSGDAISSALSIAFRGPADYFTTPATRWNESSIDADTPYVDFVAYACDDPTMRSAVAHQLVSITNVNDPANLTAAAFDFSVYALPVSEVNDDDFPTLLYLGRDAGIDLIDVDRDVDAVHVVIDSTYGLLSLDEDHVDLADFNSHSYCFSTAGGPRDWICDGTGTQDSHMSFVAAPRVANILLGGLRYEGHFPNRRDVVAIRVYDGASTDYQPSCLDNGQYKTRSVRPSCAVASIELRVDIKETASQAADARDLDQANDASRLPWQVFLAFVAAALGLCGLCLKFCCCPRRRRRRRGWCGRRAKPDDLDQPPVAFPTRRASPPSRLPSYGGGGEATMRGDHHVASRGAGWADNGPIF